MSLKQMVSKSLYALRVAFVAVTVFQFSLGGPLAGALQAQEKEPTRSPIKHVIVIVGENRTFDHLFATYKPRHGESVDNLLSKGIVNEDGTPGPNYSLAAQFAADATDSNEFQMSPRKKTLYSKLPAPLNGGPTDVCKDNGICTLGDATSSENGLDPDYYQFLSTGGTGLSKFLIRASTACTVRLRTPPCLRVHSNLPTRTAKTPSRGIPTPPAPSTAFTRCGSNSIATPLTRLIKIPAAASGIFSPGPK